MSKKLHKIPVKGGLVGHGRTFNAVVLREPTFDEYLDIGDCVEFITYPNGMRIQTINNETIRQYLQACLVEPTDSLLLSQGGIALAKEVREAIVNFIHGGPGPEGEGSKSSAPTSSGDAAKDVSLPAM